MPNSRLLLLPFNPNWATAFPVQQFEQTLAAACARHGVERDRFVMAGSLRSRADVKALESVADIYLDTAPFSGSIAVIDPLELGLPTVVWEADLHRSRMASALLREIQVPELITRSEEGYIRLAVELATKPDLRKTLSSRILAGMKRPPRFVDPQRYGQELGALLARLTGGTLNGTASPSSGPASAKTSSAARN